MVKPWLKNLDLKKNSVVKISDKRWNKAYFKRKKYKAYIKKKGNSIQKA